MTFKNANHTEHNDPKHSSTEATPLQHIINALLDDPSKVSTSANKATSESKGNPSNKSTINLSIGDQPEYSLTGIMENCRLSDISLTKAQLDQFIEWSAEVYASALPKVYQKNHQAMLKALREKRAHHYALSCLFLTLRNNITHSKKIDKKDYTAHFKRTIKAMKAFNFLKPKELQYKKNHLAEIETEFSHLLAAAASGSKHYAAPEQSQFPAHHIAREWSLYLYSTGEYIKQNALMRHFDPATTTDYFRLTNNRFILDNLLCSTVLATQLTPKTSALRLFPEDGTLMRSEIGQIKRQGKTAANLPSDTEEPTSIQPNDWYQSDATTSMSNTLPYHYLETYIRQSLSNSLSVRKLYEITALNPKQITKLLLSELTKYQNLIEQNAKNLNTMGFNEIQAVLKEELAAMEGKPCKATSSMLSRKSTAIEALNITIAPLKKVYLVTFSAEHSHEISFYTKRHESEYIFPPQTRFIHNKDQDHYDCVPNLVSQSDLSAVQAAKTASDPALTPEPTPPAPTSISEPTSTPVAPPEPVKTTKDSKPVLHQLAPGVEPQYAHGERAPSQPIQAESAPETKAHHHTKTQSPTTHAIKKENSISQPYLTEWINLLKILKYEPQKVEFKQDKGNLFAAIQSDAGFTHLTALSEFIESTDNAELMNEIVKHCETNKDGSLIPPNDAFKVVLDLVYTDINAHTVQGPRLINTPTRHLQAVIDCLIQNPEVIISDENMIKVNLDGQEKTLNILTILESEVDYSSLRMSDDMFDAYLERHKSALTEKDKKEFNRTLTDLDNRRKIFLNLEHLTNCLMNEKYPDKRSYRATFSMLVTKLEKLRNKKGKPTYDIGYIKAIKDTFSTRLKSKKNGADFSYHKVPRSEYSSISKDFFLYHYTTAAYGWLNAFLRSPGDSSKWHGSYTKNQTKNPSLPTRSITELRGQCLLENALVAVSMNSKRAQYDLRIFENSLRRKEESVVPRADKGAATAGKKSHYKAAAVTSASDPSVRSAYFEKMPHTILFSAAGSIDLSHFSEFTNEAERSFIPGQNLLWDPKTNMYQAYSSPELDEGSIEETTELNQETKKERDIRNQQALFAAIDVLDFETVQVLIDKGVNTHINKDPNQPETPVTALIHKFHAIRTAETTESVDTRSQLKQLLHCVKLLCKTEYAVSQNSNGLNAFDLLFDNDFNSKATHSPQGIDNEKAKLALFLAMAENSFSFQPKYYTEATSFKLDTQIEGYYRTCFKENTRARTKKMLDESKSFALALLKAIDGTGEARDNSKNYLVARETMDFMQKQIDIDGSFWQRTTRYNYNQRLNAFKKTLGKIFKPNIDARKSRILIDNLTRESNTPLTPTKVLKKGWMTHLYHNQTARDAAIAERCKKQTDTPHQTSEPSIKRADISEALLGLKAEFDTVLTPAFKAKKGPAWLEKQREKIQILSAKLDSITDFSQEEQPTKNFCKAFANFTLWHFIALNNGHIEKIPEALKKAAGLIGEATGNASLKAIASITDSEVKAFATNLKSVKRRRTVLAVGAAAASAVALPIAGKVFLSMKALSALAGVSLKAKLGIDLVAAAGIGLGANSIIDSTGKHSLLAFTQSKDQSPIHQESISTKVKNFLDKTRNTAVKQTMQTAQRVLGIEHDATLTSTRGIDGFFCKLNNKTEQVEKQEIGVTEQAKPSADNWVITTSCTNKTTNSTSNLALTFNRKNNLRTVSMNHSSLEAKKLVQFLKHEGKKTINIRATTLTKEYVISLKHYAKKAGITVRDQRKPTDAPTKPADDEGRLDTPFI